MEIFTGAALGIGLLAAIVSGAATPPTEPPNTDPMVVSGWQPDGVGFEFPAYAESLMIPMQQRHENDDPLSPWGLREMPWVPEYRREVRGNLVGVTIDDTSYR